jgi:enoyl-CoA hydratase/carnithine racemase
VAEDVRIERLPGPEVARLVLARPERRNAVTASMLAQVAEALGILAADAGIRAIVLAGDGPDFCAGADLGELEAARASGGGREYARTVEDALLAVEGHPVPVIAQVQGAALGAGCQLVLACDLAVAAEDARLGIPSARLGVVIDLQNIDRLVRAVGGKRAGAMLLAGHVCTGPEAARWGLVNDVVPPSDLEERATALAAAVARSAPLSVRGSKLGIRAVTAPAGEDPATATEAFERAAEAAFASDDLAEGIRSFRERRPPSFEGS